MFAALLFNRLHPPLHRLANRPDIKGWQRLGPTPHAPLSRYKTQAQSVSKQLVVDAQ